jgi:hypothetical protein
MDEMIRLNGDPLGTTLGDAAGPADAGSWRRRQSIFAEFKRTW